MKSCYVNLAGGLGNQLFQVAAGYAYSKKHGKNLCLNCERWSASQGRQPEIYSNSIFRNFKYASPIGEVFPFFEKRFNFDEIPHHNGNISLNGYFQSLKYFEEYREKFVDKLQLPNTKIDWIDEKNVAMHVRRGDYLMHHDIHLVCNTNYFIKCLEEFPDYQVNVFTDSPEYIQKEFAGYDFNIIHTGDELLDLTLMSHHDNMICSNSSFSWWASLLSKKKDKILVPSKWFNNFKENYDDVFREEFIRVEVGG